MNCTNCQKPLTDSQVYCNSCGLKNRPSKLDNWINVYTDFGDIEINTTPLTWEECKRIGAIAYHSGQLYEALEYFEQALKFQIDDTNEMSSIFNELGIIYGQLGDDKKSLMYLNLSVASNPNNFTALENRAAQKIYMEDEKGGIEDIQVLIRNKKMKPHIWHYLGVALENIKEYERARVAYTEAVSSGYEKAAKDLEELLQKMHSQKK